MNLINDGKMLGKIEAPRKFNFRIVKDRLPKSRFQSLQKQTIESNKENLKNNSMVASTQKSQVLKRSSSHTRRRLSPMKKPLVGNKKQTIEKPPLPQLGKNNLIRG